MRKWILTVITVMIVASIFIVQCYRNITLARNLMKDYYYIVNEYANAIDYSGEILRCPAFYGKKYDKFNQLCISNNCHISGSVDERFSGTFFGNYFKVTHMYPCFEWKIYPSESYMLGYVFSKDTGKWPIVNYKRRFVKSGHKITIDFWISFEPNQKRGDN